MSPAHPIATPNYSGSAYRSQQAGIGASGGPWPGAGKPSHCLDTFGTVCKTTATLGDDKVKRRLRKAIRILAPAGAVVLAAAVVFVRWGNDIAIALESGAPSRSIGKTSDGRLVNGDGL